jgi:hypothetical protein
MMALTKRFLAVTLLVLVLAACSATSSAVDPRVQIDNPYAPQAGDESLVKADVRVVKTEVSSQQGSPVQFSVKISFFKPTPCDQFRVTVSPPDADGQIQIEIYSLMKQGQVCTLMATLDPTEATVSLEGFTAGHYIVVVNGVRAAEFDA